MAIFLEVFLEYRCEKSEERLAPGKTRGKEQGQRNFLPRRPLQRGTEWALRQAQRPERQGARNKEKGARARFKAKLRELCIIPFVS
jgi:hypothetical protein